MGNGTGGWQRRKSPELNWLPHTPVASTPTGSGRVRV